MQGRGRELTLRIVSDTTAIKKSTDATATGIGKISKQINGLGVAFGGLFVADKLLGFLGDAMQAARDDAREVALLNREIENLGISAEEAAPTVDALIQSWAEFGVADSKVREALQRSIQLTDDWQAALDLTNLAIEVSTALNLDSAAATDLITKAVQGSTKAQHALGLSYEDTRTPQAVVLALTEKYAGATEAASTETDKLNNSLGELAEGLGAELFNLLNLLAADVLQTFSRLGKAVEALRRGDWEEAILLFNGLEGHVDRGTDALVKFTQAELDAAQGSSENTMSLRAQEAALLAVESDADRLARTLLNLDAEAKVSGIFTSASKAINDAIGSVFGTVAEIVAPPVEVRFKRITFPTLTDDLISAATKALNEPSNQTKWKSFWEDELLPALNSGRPRKIGIGRDILREISDEIAAGNIAPGALPEAMRRALNALQVSDLKGVIGRASDRLTDAFSLTIRPIIEVIPKIIVKKGAGGGTAGVQIKIIPLLAPPPAQPAGTGKATAGTQAAPTVNIHMSGIGADPVRIGREVSKALDAYRSRGGTIARRA